MKLPWVFVPAFASLSPSITEAPVALIAHVATLPALLTLPRSFSLHTLDCTASIVPAPIH
jgi:hypothetical protein